MFNPNSLDEYAKLNEDGIFETVYHMYNSDIEGTAMELYDDFKSNLIDESDYERLYYALRASDMNQESNEVEEYLEF